MESERPYLMAIIILVLRKLLFSSSANQCTGFDLLLCGLDDAKLDREAGILSCDSAPHEIHSSPI